MRTTVIIAGALIAVLMGGEVVLLCALRLRTPRGPRVATPEGRTHDFGEVREDESVEHVFPIQNTGSRTLKILKVKTGCGCVNAKANVTEIEPGAKAEIEISYKGRRVRARESVAALVRTNDVTNPFVEFILTGFVRYKVFWYPQSVAFMGKCGTPLEPKQVRFLASRQPQGTCELEVVSVSSSVISAELLDDERGTALRIAVAANCPLGAYAESVIVKRKGDESTTPIAIPVYIRIL